MKATARRSPVATGTGRRPTVAVRFSASLAQLPARLPGETWMRARWRAHQTVKDLAESFGIPHPEIGAVIVDGSRNALDVRPSRGARIEYLGYDEAPASTAPLPPVAPPGERRFVADVHLAALARILRLAGFDTAHRLDDPGDHMLAELAGSGRILLTRDVGLLKRRQVRFGYWLRATRTDNQWLDVAQRYDLSSRMRPFTRCTLCNYARIDSTGATAAAVALAPADAQEPVQCPHCGQVYWRGSHHRRIEHLLRSAKN